jgi:hypothetical protein
MRRRHISIPSTIPVLAASLILTIAASILWIRSYWLSDTYGFSRLAMVFTDRGELVSFSAEPDANFEMGLGYSREELPNREEIYNPRRVSERTWNVLVAHGERFAGLRITVVRLWAVVLVLASPFLVLFAQVARRRIRTNRGRCPRCGYDLRATPDRCPECGAVPAPPAPAA